MVRKGGFTLDDRKREILTSIVRTHCETGQPVGSTALSRLSRERLSSATIRNICAELETDGYLSHPHTSAGRIPTDRGYRYYVDNLMGLMKLSRPDVARIREQLLDEESLASPEVLMQRTSHLLSQLSDNVGIVISPAVAEDQLHHIEFLKLSDSRILVIMVSRGGRVQDRVIRIDVEFKQDDLNSTSRFLVDNFQGWSLTEIRDELLRRMTEEKALYDKLLRNAILLCGQGLPGSDRTDVFIEGASNILSKPDFADTERMRALFKILEERGRMVRILNECIESARLELVAVRIGAENDSCDLHDCTVIASRCFSAGSKVVGSLGVVGPTRIEYDRLIGVVSYIARLFERALDPDNAAEASRIDLNPLPSIGH